MTEMQRARGAHSRDDALGHVGSACNGRDGVHKRKILPVLRLASGHLGLLNLTGDGIKPETCPPQQGLGAS